jgi:hypothetical protein
MTPLAKSKMVGVVGVGVVVEEDMLELVVCVRYECVDSPSV